MGPSFENLLELISRGTPMNPHVHKCNNGLGQVNILAMCEEED